MLLLANGSKAPSKLPPKLGYLKFRSLQGRQWSFLCTGDNSSNRPISFVYLILGLHLFLLSPLFYFGLWWTLNFFQVFSFKIPFQKSTAHLSQRKKENILRLGRRQWSPLSWAFHTGRCSQWNKTRKVYRRYIEWKEQ